MRKHPQPLKALSFGVGLALQFSLFTPTSVWANGANGVVMFNLDANALATLLGGKNQAGSRYMYVEEVFDASYNNVAIKGDDPNPTPGIDPIPANNIQFNVNGATIPPAPEDAGRLLQANTFNYTDDPTKGTGEVAFSGAIRYHSDVWPGTLLMREMTLSYEAGRVNKAKLGESGWVIKAHEPFFGTTTVFDLTDVKTSTVNGALKLSGNVFITDTWAALLAISPGIKVGEVNLIPAGDSQPTTNTAVANYDDNSKLVSIPDVQVGNQHYQASLQLQANGLYGLKSSNLLSKATATAPAVYDTSNNSLVIPKVNAFGKSYKATLTNIGNYVFRLDKTTEIQ